MSATKVLTQNLCSSDRLSPHQPKHMAPSLDGVAAIGNLYPVPEHSGSQDSWPNNDAAQEQKPATYTATLCELRELAFNGEPLSQPSAPAPSRARTISSRDEQRSVSDFISATQSFELRNLTKSQGGDINLPDAEPVIPLDLSISEEDTLQAELSEVTQSQEVSPSQTTFSVEKSIIQRLTGGWDGIRPAQAASVYPIKIKPFRIGEVRLIKKNLYNAYKEAVDTLLVAKWHSDIHHKFRKNVEAVIQGIGLQPKDMIVNVGLSMVGPKVGGMLHLLPTIVIVCAHKLAKSRLEQLINSGQLDYLRGFECSSLVYIQGRERKLRDRFFADADSVEKTDPTGVISPYDLSFQTQNYLSFGVEDFRELRSACGLRIGFMNSVQLWQDGKDLQKEGLAFERQTAARIGGTIYVGEHAFAMTAAHAFIFHELDAQSDAGNDSDSSSDTDSSSDSDSDTEFDQQNAYVADCATIPGKKAVRTKRTVWMEMGSLSGCYAFCDHGRSFDSQELVSLMSPNSDWCTMSMDWINYVTNYYCAKNQKGEDVEVVIDEIGLEDLAEAGDVHILESPEKPMSAYMTQTDVSIYFGGKSLNVRRLVSEGSLPAGLSGCWVVRGKQLLGHIIGGNEFEKTVYMVSIQDTKRAIEELTGSNMSLTPTYGAKILPEKLVFSYSNFQIDGPDGSMVRITETTDPQLMRCNSHLCNVVSCDTAVPSSLNVRQPYENGRAIRSLLNFVDNSIMGLRGPHLNIDGYFKLMASFMEYFAAPDSLRRILEEIWPGEQPPVREHDIFNGYIRVLTILLFMGRGTLIEHFLQHDTLADNRLPFIYRPDTFPTTIGGTDFFHDFQQHQWRFESHAFANEQLANQKLLKYEPGRTLNVPPFSPGFTRATGWVAPGMMPMFGEHQLENPKSLGLGILECPFNLLFCYKQFSNVNDWIQHSLTHFGSCEPPPFNTCCFCEAVFDCWMDRMMHVSLHHQLGHRLSHARPDFQLFAYMWCNRLISTAEYRDLRGNSLSTNAPALSPGSVKPRSRSIIERTQLKIDLKGNSESWFSSGGKVRLDRSSLPADREPPSAQAHLKMIKCSIETPDCQV